MASQVPGKRKQRQSAKGRKALTKGMVKRMEEAFREYGDNYSKVARVCGIDRRTAKRGWELGWEYMEVRPIKETMLAEQNQARIVVANSSRSHAAQDLENSRIKAEYEEMKAERSLAAKDALESRKEESQMVRLLRSDTIASLAAIARMLPGMQKWAKEAGTLLMESSPKNAAEALAIMDKTSKVVERVASAADRVMAMERRLLGQPEQIVGVAMPELSMEEALEHLEASDRTLTRMAAAGMLPEGFKPGATIINIPASRSEDTDGVLPGEGLPLPGGWDGLQ